MILSNPFSGHISHFAFTPSTYNRPNISDTHFQQGLSCWRISLSLPPLTQSIAWRAYKAIVLLLFEYIANIICRDDCSSLLSVSSKTSMLFSQSWIHNYYCLLNIKHSALSQDVRRENDKWKDIKLNKMHNR